MDLQWNQNKKAEEGKLKGETKEAVPPKQVTTAISPASPPSSTSSPNHEFSFTISLHSSSATPPDNKSSKTAPSFAIDLTPADDIFFHGHLLPLHLLSHLPVSPRSSTNSLDSFTLPIREFLDDQAVPARSDNNSSNINSNNNSNKSKSCNDIINSRKNDGRKSSNLETKGRSKAKSFSLFGWRKESELRDKEDKEKQKKKLRFDVRHVLRRYARLVRPLLFFRGRKQNMQFQRQPYSFSGNLSLSNKHEMGGRRGQLSAPASIRTSPTNSGLLVATPTLASSKSDSTMEELQAAIQAAIAHCKNSIAAEEKIKC